MLKKRIPMALALLMSAMLFVSAIGTALAIGAADEPQTDAIATVPEDYSEGSLTFTPSQDGATVTISYLRNGEPVSYTVPNNPNYLFGGYAGVDDLGRSLYTSDDEGVGVAAAEQERYVGLFYFLWQGTRSVNQDPSGWRDFDGVARNLQQILDGVSDVGLGQTGEYHWFAEPLYGYYMAGDEWVLRKHAELLTNAGIDFLFIDYTNNVSYNDNALKLMKILHELNEQGYDAPQVVFYTNTESSKRIGEVYRDIYGPEMYPDTWFCIDGKPVIVAPIMDADKTFAEVGVTPDTEANVVTTDTLIPNTEIKIADYFTVKSTQWPIEYGVPNNFVSNNNSWPWMDFHWPQKVYTDAEGQNGAISVSIAQMSGTGNFSDSAMYGYLYNRGRSFQSQGTTTNNWSYSAQNAAYNRKVAEATRAARENRELSYQGLNFQEQFDYAIASDAKYILVTGWNEWIAGKWEDASRPDGNFVDCASIEYSRDAEMMRGGYFDNYYWQIIYNVQRIKGTAPLLVQDARKPVDVTGSFDQWTDVAVTYADPAGDTADRNNQALSPEGYITATNTSGRNDIVAAKMIADTKNLYFYIQTAEEITAYDTESSWMQVYVNTDRDETTGWYGYDFIINERAESDSRTTVAAYTGTDGAYGFTPVGETVSYRVEGNQMMIAVPLSQLGIEDYLAIDLEFKVADSDTRYDEMEDFYCDGDVAPLGRLNYIYSNYAPIIEAETEPETESETEGESVAVTESESADETDATTPAESETPPAASDTEPTTDPATDSDGCASGIAVSGVLILLLAVPALIKHRRNLTV